MKKLKVSLVATCIFVSSLFCLPAFSCANYDLYNEDYTEWYAQNGCMGFTTTLSDYSAYGFILINGIKVRALFSLGTPYGYSVEIDYDESLGVSEEPLHYVDESYAMGCYKAVFDGSVKDGVLSAQSFTICGMEFPAFEMYSRKVAPSTVNARDYADCSWVDEDNCIFISSYTTCSINVYTGTIKVNGEDIQIHFKWCDGNRFEIYNGEDGAEERNILASGTYTNAGPQLTLLVEEDETFGLAGRTIELTADMS